MIRNLFALIGLYCTGRWVYDKVQEKAFQRALAELRSDRVKQAKDV